MTKKLVSIRIDRGLHRKIRELGLNLSGFVEAKLKELLYIQNLNNNTQHNEFQSSRAHGLVGYDVALTRRRSGVRIPVGPFRILLGT